MSDPNTRPTAVGMGVNPPLSVEQVPEPGTDPPSKLLSLRERLISNAAPLPGDAPPVSMGVNRTARPNGPVGGFVAAPAAAPVTGASAAEAAWSAGPRREAPGRVEVEMKFRMPTRSDATGNEIDAVADVHHRARQCPGFQRLPSLRESDEYFTAPWMAADTYLRVRHSRYESESGVPAASDLTWKGPLVGTGAKTRREETVVLRTPDNDAAAMSRLLAGVGYTPFAVVVKDRQVFKLTHAGSDVTMTFDRVDGLGGFVELEILTIEPAAAGAEAILKDLARHLGLGEQERRGYVQLVTANANAEGVGP